MTLSSYFPCFFLYFERVTPLRIGFAQLFIEDYDEKAQGKKYFLVSLCSTNTALIALTAIWREMRLWSAFLCGPIKTMALVFYHPLSRSISLKLHSHCQRQIHEGNRKTSEENGTAANDLPQSLNGIISHAMWCNFLTPCWPIPLWRTNRFKPDRLRLFVPGWELEP